MQNAPIVATGEPGLPASGHRSPPQVLIWDPLLRLFHWGLALGFAVAFLVEDDLLAVHVWAGYLVLALIAFRLAWGFVGPRHARWSDFVRTPGEIRAYLADVVRFRAVRHLGHNPAGGAMIAALLLGLTATGLSGLMLYAVQELSGPLAPLLQGLPPSWGPVLEDIHEVLANMSLLLVFLHLLGVAVASLQHGENLPRAMITGYKRSDTP
jgi:cytochrome b